VDRRQKRKAIGGSLEERMVIGMNHRLNGPDPGILRKQEQATAQHRFSGYFLVLLGKFSAGAYAATGSDHNRRDTGRHFRPFLSPKLDRLTASAMGSKTIL
jgi:hypothetical protein